MSVKFFFAFLVLVISLPAQAHSTLLASYLLKYDAMKQQWHLSINFPLYSLHKALLTHHSEDLLKDKQGQYNKEIAQQYLLTQTNIVANDKVSLRLKPTTIDLDNHQSSFKYHFENMPKNLSKLSFDIRAMSENLGHTNIVRVFLKSGRKKAVLSERTNYQGFIHIK